VLRFLGINVDLLQVGVRKGLIIMMTKMGIVILAATLAGAGSSHGLAHGFWVGVIVSVGNLLHSVLFVNPGETIDVIAILSEIGWVWIICILAGGFGSRVIPPMIYLAKKRRVNPSNVSVPVD
jgi:hypothetical protein